MKPSVSPGFTNVVVIPKRGSVNLNKLTVPPYNCDEAIIWSPEFTKVIIAKKTALCPEAVAMAAVPPSKAHTLSSKTPTVGLDILL